MPLFAEAAAQKGLMEYRVQGLTGKQNMQVNVGGFTFEVPVNPGSGGRLNVPTVYPKGVAP